MDQVDIQYQGRGGNWSTVMRVQNLAENIANGMRSVARANPGCRVRAVDSRGRVVDIL
ncbi:hypothetical protein V5F53_19265 [Xanthobacter sp. V4C-4]|uniref:hypothetical protein n=1 Tax=Xanthobacter cornucopiae TaxID=3119924 RepID=UPI00372C8BE4